MSGSIQDKMARGALWMVLLTFVDRAFGFISTLILVRLLSPADFGLVAMALSFIFLAQLLSAFGFDIALIHSRNATTEHYHTAWTLNVVLGVVILLLMVAAAGPIADFYQEPSVFWVVCALSLGPLIGGCENIGVVAFRKDLEFRKEFAFQISRRLIGFAVSIPLALLLRNHWALVAGTLVSRLGGTVISYVVHSFRPRLSLAHAGNLFRFSKWLLLNNVAGFLKERSSDFTVGRLLGAGPLGIYNISYEVAIMPTTELSAPVNRALLPGFSRMAHDAEAMRAAYRNAIGLLTLIALPAAFGIFTLAPFLVPVTLGSKWLAGVPLMEILAFNGALLLFHSSICTVLIANGEPDRVATTNGLYVVVLLMLFAVLVPAFGLTGVAFAALVTSVLSTPVYLLQVKRSIGVPPSTFLRVAARPAAAAAVMAGLVRWILPDWSADMHPAAAIGWLLGGIAAGAVIYTAVVLLLWLAAGRPSGAERMLIDHVGEQRVRRRRVAPAFS